jgi:hypothetical protein
LQRTPFFDKQLDCSLFTQKDGSYHLVWDGDQSSIKPAEARKCLVRIGKNGRNNAARRSMKKSRSNKDQAGR